MSRRMLRNAGRKLSLVGLLGTLALAFSLDGAAAVGVLDVRKIISAPGTPSEADKKTIDAYLNPFFRSGFMSPTDGMTVPNLRKDYGNIVRGVGKTPGHDYLNAIVYKYASAIAAGPSTTFKPTAKYNAMLMLADLNESDVPGAIRPYPNALKALYNTLRAPESDSDYLKAAALIGITRLAEEKALPASAVAPISGLLLSLLTDADPPAGRSASAHNFMRRSAARALAAIGNPGPNNQVVSAMRSIMVDPNARITLRCEMAQLLGQLTIPAESKVDYLDLANLIGWQAVEICEQELARSQEEKREPSRRIVMYALQSSYAGLHGMGGSAEKNQEAASFISKVKNKIYQLHGQLDDVSKVPDDKILDTVEPALEEIRPLLKPKPQPEANPTPAPATTPAPVTTATAATPAN